MNGLGGNGVDDWQPPLKYTCPDETDPDAYGELIPDDEIRRDLYCPACGLWIGDPDDPTISMISLKHDSAGYNGSWHCA